MPYFFMFCEDIDYCHRINMAGGKIYYVPTTQIIHYKGESTKKNNLDYVITFNRSLYQFYKKHYQQKYIYPFKWLILFGTVLRGITVFIRNNVKIFYPVILDLIIFEAWIGALDRHGGNYLTHEGEVWAIDFEDSFATKTGGSELCLYFPWIKESQDELKNAIKNFKANILNKRLLNEDIWLEQFSSLLKVLDDQRAKIALRSQLSKMYDLLQENFLHIETLVNVYLHQDHMTLEFLDEA